MKRTNTKWYQERNKIEKFNQELFLEILVTLAEAVKKTKQQNKTKRNRKEKRMKEKRKRLNY